MPARGMPPSSATAAVQLGGDGVRRRAACAALLDALPLHPASGEYYLTDAVAVGGGPWLGLVAVEGAAEEGLGVNSQAQLAEARSNPAAPSAARGCSRPGCIMLAPETVQLCASTARSGPGP